ncbi:unnamed protein product [Gadus morhua 'NCC']
MLVTMLTAMFMVVRAAESFDGYRRNSIGVFTKNQASMAIASASLAIPCLLSCSEGSNGASSPPALRPMPVEEAAATIQTHFRKLQEKKQKKK